MPTKPKAPRSKAEETFALQCRVVGLVPAREYRFKPPRRWRFDFCWPELKIAVEIEGGIWTGGRHTRGGGFIADLEKLNHAAALGFRVFRFPTAQVQDGTAIAFMDGVIHG